MTFDKFFEKGFEIFLIVIVGIGVDALRDVSKSINELNVKIGVMVERTEEQSKRIENHEGRIHSMEVKESKPH